MLISLLILILLPIFTNNFIINTNFYSKVSNDNWIAFLGSYLGGILGGLGTLAGVLITLRESRKESIKPFLVIDFDENSKEIYNPEAYSKINEVGKVINFYQVPLISKIFDISIRNTGKGYAKNIDVTFLIEMKDALITDKDLFWLSTGRLAALEKIEVIKENYVQNHKITYIESEGGKKILPINASLNGIIMCSIWNIIRFLSLTTEEFNQTRKYYDIKKKMIPLTIPDIYIRLQYSDLDNNNYETMYKLGFDFILEMAGQYSLIRAKLDFNCQSVIKKKYEQLSRNKNKNKPKKITRKMKKNISEIDKWRENVYEFGVLSLGLSDSSSKSMSNDNAILRYFYLCYEREQASLEQLIIIIAMCCYNEIDLKKFSRKKIINFHTELRDRLLDIIKYNSKNKYSRIISKQEVNYNEINDLARLKRILNSEKDLVENYFKSYEKNDGKEKQMIHIYNSGKSAVNINVNIGDRNMKTELGFFRIGFNYRKVENIENNLIVSAIASVYKNEEVGFLDESGAYFENDHEWECIYQR